MLVKPKLYYTHLGKSHYTYGERAFYCPACDKQFESIDEYHKHVAQVCHTVALRSIAYSLAPPLKMQSGSKRYILETMG